MTETDLLLASAARLYSIGVDLDASREELAALVRSGLPLTAPRVLDSCRRFSDLNSMWQRLESEHTDLLNKIQSGK